LVPRLAPLYDLVCIGFLDRLGLRYERKLAFFISGNNLPEKVTRDDWAAHARALGVPPKSLLEHLRQMASELPALAKETRASFAERHGDNPAHDRLEESIRDRCGWTLRGERLWRVDSEVRLGRWGAADGDAGVAMAKLIYASNMSLDGCTEDEHGAFDWAPPDDEVFVFITELMGSAGTYLYGRRMYETLAVWETAPTLAAHSDLEADYARAWQAADKVVYSSTLAGPLTSRTRLERRFEPHAIRDLKAAASRDLLVGGPHLAVQALGAGLVDELILFVWPVVLGGRNPALPTNARVDLELIDQHRFHGGVLHLRYRVRSAGNAQAR
jgi:dihydrofolate reductase